MLSTESNGPLPLHNAQDFTQNIPRTIVACRQEQAASLPTAAPAPNLLDSRGRGGDPERLPAYNPPTGNKETGYERTVEDISGGSGGHV
jgi:hypothetical protein